MFGGTGLRHHLHRAGFHGFGEDIGSQTHHLRNDSLGALGIGVHQRQLHHLGGVHRLDGDGRSQLAGVILIFQAQICQNCFQHVFAFQHHRIGTHQILGGVDVIRSHHRAGVAAVVDDQHTAGLVFGGDHKHCHQHAQQTAKHRAGNDHEKIIFQDGKYFPQIYCLVVLFQHSFLLGEIFSLSLNPIYSSTACF